MNYGVCNLFTLKKVSQVDLAREELKFVMKRVKINETHEDEDVQNVAPREVHFGPRGPN